MYITSFTQDRIIDKDEIIACQEEHEESKGCHISNVAFSYEI